MVLSGINFSLYFFAWRTKIRYLLRSEEVRLYLGIILLGSLIVGVDLYRHGVYSLYGLEAFQNAFFQVAAIVSTTGFAIGDFGSWPNLSKVVIFFLFFVGSCAGSTGGSIKCIRWVICAKTIKRDFTRVLPPHAVSQIKVDDKVLSGESIAAIKSFVILYFLVFAAGSVLISLDGVDMTTAVSTVAITLGNIGFGFGSVSPSGSFAFYSDGSKLLLSFLMLLGRLELFTVLLLFTPAFWKKAI
jgi:trk system potassium uptake protein TrkH